MEGEHVIPDEIRQLLERRSTFQEWLHRLDELDGGFRPEVSGKVRTDYANRLSEVEGELQGHRDALESALSKRRSAVDDAEGRHDVRSAELEESRLRHTVGEFDDAEWEKQRKQHQSVLDKLDAELAEHRAAVDMLEVVLAELNAPARTPSEAESPAEEPPVPGEVVTAEDGWPTPEPTTGDFEAAESGEETAAVTETVAEEGEEEDLVTDASNSKGPSEFADELEFLESLSLDDARSFDAVSAMLEESEEEGGDGKQDADAATEDR
jgi:hypothetical protein